MDRLAEMRGRYGQNETTVVVNDDVGQKSELDDFFKMVNAVQSGITIIEQSTEQVKAKHSEALMNTDVEKGKAISAELDQLMSTVTSKSAEVKQMLKLMEEETKIIPKESKPAEVRIRQNQHQQLTSCFVGAMKAYQAASEQYSSKYKDQVKRRIRTRCSAKDGRPLTEEEVDKYATQVLEEGKEDALFAQARDALQQVQENHRDILRIEASMRELNQIFADMAVLVEEQGELMDDILVNVSKSVEYVTKGREELQQAKVYAKKSRKKMCCLLIILLFAAAVILVPMYFTGMFK